MARAIWVDRPACTGCNICVEMCPDVFELDEDAIAVIHNPGGDTVDAVQECMDACPENCLHWRDGSDADAA